MHPGYQCPVPLITCRKPDENRRHAVLRILTRCSTSFRFAPCLAPISQVFQPPMVLMPNFSFNHVWAQKSNKILMGQDTGCYARSRAPVIKAVTSSGEVCLMGLSATTVPRRITDRWSQT